MKKWLLYTLLFASFQSHAQMLTGISTKWNDTYGEWNLYTDDPELEGELHLRWLTNNDWTEWEYRLGDVTGTIRRKWKDNPNEWEIRSSSDIVTMRTLYANNFHEWRITGKQTLTWKSRYGNNSNEWLLDDNKSGSFQMLTVWEGNPGDWIVEDELDEAINLPTKIAMVFLVVVHSSPKF
jgi:hypothetical protein